MRTIILAASIVLVGLPAIAEPPVDISRETCVLLALSLREGDKMRPDVAMFLEGLWAGVTSGGDAQSLADRFSEACFAQPTISIATALASIADD